MTVATTSEISSLLHRLGLADENPGAFDGAWIPTHGKRYDSLNPATGEVIATVLEASTADYEKVAASSVAAFHEWKKWPAPKRMARTAISRFASAVTMIALFPPSSRIVLPKRPATVCATCRPMTVDPVNEISGSR